jgi:hypothetical protein
MKIAYRKKYNNINFFFGTIWLATAIIQVNDGLVKWYDYVWFVLSAVYFAVYFYQKNEKYLTIKNGILKENWPFGKKVKLSEIKKIKVFAGDYIIITDKKEMTINTLIISPNSFEELKNELEKLNLDWTK